MCKKNVFIYKRSLHLFLQEARYISTLILRIFIIKKTDDENQTFETIAPSKSIIYGLNIYQVYKLKSAVFFVRKTHVFS